MTAVLDQTYQVSDPSCGGANGFDRSWEFTPGITGDYFIDASNSNFTASVVVDDGCGGAELACGVFPAEVTVNLTAGQTYVIHVNAFSSLTPLPGNIELSVVLLSPEICNDAFDNDSDGDIDCADVDCVGDPNCLVEFCDNATDDDGDGDIDCVDSDCVGMFPCGVEVCDDGFDNDGNGFADCVDQPGCATDALCCPSRVIPGPGIYNDVVTNASNVNEAGCGSGGGFDVGFEFTAAVTTDYRFEASGGFDPLVAVDDGCGGAELACDRAFNASVVQVPLTAGQTVVVFVEAVSQFTPLGNGNVTLEVIEQPPEICDDGVDNDNDGVIDCLDDSCFSSALCAEVCDDGVDNNGNGDIDCVDGGYCAADLACCPLDTGALGQNLGMVTMMNAVNEPTCTPVFFSGSGPETSFEFTVPTTGDYILHAQNSDFLYTVSVREGCAGAEIGCQQLNDLVVRLEAGVTYVAYVDAWSATTSLNSGAAELNIVEVTPSEITCDNGIDDDLDGDEDCDDPDCVYAVNCFEICDNSIDDDGDGLIDCDDNGCAGDPQCCPVNVTAGLGTYMGNTVGASDLNQPSCTSTSGSDITFEFTAPADGSYTFDTLGSGFDTILTLLDSCGGTELECDDDIGGGVTQSEITRFMVSGETVIVVVDGFNGAAGQVTLNIQ